MPTTSDTLVMAAVAYDPKVVSIWEGFKAWFARRGFAFDYVLYSNYERQVESLMAGEVHVAWNSPLAWLRAERLAKAAGQPVSAIVMRDTDQDLASLIVVRADSGIEALPDLAGKTVAVGASDSPQGSLLPLLHLHRAGLQAGRDFELLRFELLRGKHGDHIGGERDAARALTDGRADAACMIEANYQLFMGEGTLAPGATRALARTPRFDHCNFTVSPDAPRALVDRFRALLLEMSYDDPEVRPLFDLEGLKAWREARVEGYRDLEEAIGLFGVYGPKGEVSGDLEPAQVAR